MSEATPTGVRPFLNDRPDSRTRSLPDSTPWLGTPSIWEKKKEKEKIPHHYKGRCHILLSLGRR